MISSKVTIDCLGSIYKSDERHHSIIKFSYELESLSLAECFTNLLDLAHKDIQYGLWCKLLLMPNLSHKASD